MLVCVCVGGYHLIKGDFRRVTVSRLCLNQRNGGDKDRDERKGWSRRGGGGARLKRTTSSASLCRAFGCKESI